MTDRQAAWLYEPSHRNEAIAILRRLFRSGDIDPAGLNCVLELRSRYGRPERLLNDPAKYCGLSFSEEAR